VSSSDLGCMVSFLVSVGVTFLSSWHLEPGSKPE
jgi:hypothetical protein